MKRENKGETRRLAENKKKRSDSWLLTLGGWDSGAVKFLKDMARQSARRWGQNNAEEIKYFFQRLSVALQRGNASLLVERDTDAASV